MATEASMLTERMKPEPEVARRAKRSGGCSGVGDGGGGISDGRGGIGDGRGGISEIGRASCRERV